jgi:Zn ribbon nucleic-acid-binding protein
MDFPESQSKLHMASVCKHPRVRVVSRHDDVEFVECLECGEVFDSEEFNDMEIEETADAEQAETDS